MAEYHTSVGVTTSQDIMQVIYDHVSNVASPLTFADDTGTAAVHDGTTFGTPTGAAWWGTGSYMVIEGPHPNASVWQIKIERLTATNIQTTNAPNGGWTTAGFGGALTGAVVTQALGSSLVASGDAIWCSSSVGEDTYNTGASSVAYFRVMWFDSGSSAWLDGVYVGNFIPLDDTDGKPFVSFRGTPSSADSGSYWGSDAVSGNESETWAEAAQITLTFATAQGPPNINTPATDFNGNYVSARVHVQSGGAYTLGYLGDNAFRCISNSLSSGSIAVGADYVGGEGFLHKWVP